MGYRGKVIEQQRARELRAEGWALVDIAQELGVSKSSASLWCRGIDPGPRPARRTPRPRGPNALQRRKAEEIERLAAEGRARIGRLSERDLLTAGTALYAGEGGKRPGEVAFTNSDPAMVALFCAWLRATFEIDEGRLRVRLYLHQGLDVGAATDHWAEVTGIPVSQFHAPYRSVADASIRSAKHVHGCATVRYGSSPVHRGVMGLVGALLSCDALSGVAQPAEQGTVNAKVVGSSPTPGADGAASP